MTKCFLMVCEAEGDFETASGLADRVFEERGPAWLRELLEHRPLAEHRAWVGPDATASFVAWHDLRRVRGALGLRPSVGRFDGAPGARMAVAGRDALAVARELGVDAAWLVHDDDGVEVRPGLEQARATEVFRRPIVLGVPKHEMEAWLLNGFEPASEEERGLVAQVRREVGFDPLVEAHRLDAKHDHDKRSAKRVLEALTRGDRDRRERCSAEPSLERLAARGQESGLASYLEEVETRALPLLT